MWTLDEAKEYLHLWLEAERAASTGASYRIGSRSLTRVDMKEIADRIKFWRNEIERLESGRSRGLRVMRAVPRDI